MKNHHARTIFIISGKNPLISSGGYEVLARALAKTLRDLGYDVRIFCCGPKSKIQNTEIGLLTVVGSSVFSLPALKGREMAGLPVLAFHMARAIVPHYNAHPDAILWGIGPWSLAGALIKQYSPDATLLAHYSTSIPHEYAGTLSAVNAADHGWKNFLEARVAGHTLIPIYTLIEKYILAKADRIITHYDSTERILRHDYDIPKKKFVRLPYALETATQKSACHSPFILAVSRHDGRKGIHILLHALATLNRRGIQFRAVIAGDGPLLKAHRALSQRLHLSGVAIPGHVPNLSPLWQKASMFILPSLEEGSSALVILEAMQRGIPIVATTVDGLPEDIIHKESGLLVPPKDPDALAGAVQRLLSDTHLARTLATGAKQAYAKNHSPAKAKQAIARVLASLNVSRTRSYSTLRPKVLTQDGEKIARQIVSCLAFAFPSFALKRANLLDVGASSGLVTFHVAGYVKKATGIDVDETAIQKGKRTYRKKNLSLQVFNGATLPYQNGSFDLVIFRLSLCMVKHRDTLVSEIYRVLAPGGLCYFEDNNRLFPWDEDYRLPFLPILPQWVSRWCVKHIAKARWYPRRYPTFREVNRLFLRFTVRRVTPYIIKNPQRFGFTRLYPIGRITRFLPLWMLQLAEPFLPSFIFVFQKSRLSSL